MGVRWLRHTTRLPLEVVVTSFPSMRWWVGDPGVPLELLEPPVWRSTSSGAFAAMLASVRERET